MSDAPAAWRAGFLRSGPLGPLAIVSAAVLAAYPAYLWLATVDPLLAGSEGHANDFLAYYQGARRFMADTATLYADRDYMYPPPSVLLFVALSTGSVALGWCAMASLTLAAVVLSVVLFARVWTHATGSGIDRTTWAGLLVVALASAPVMQTVKMGQASALVLPTILAALAWWQRRPAGAGLALAVGFWLKVYPLGLAVLAIRGREKGRLALGLALGLVGLPLLALAAVPGELYVQWADLMAWYGGRSNVGAMNQGLPAVVERMRLGPEAFSHYTDRVLGGWARWATVVTGLGLGAATLGAYFLKRWGVEATGVALLAVIPILSSYGWEHAYVLALPLLWWTLLRARAGGWAERAAALVAGLVLLIPKPPESILARALSDLPRPISDLFYARFLIVVLALLAVHVVPAWRRGRSLD